LFDSTEIDEALADFVISRVIGITRALPTRWIQHCTLTQMHEEYVFWYSMNKLGSAASFSTFRAVWKSSWRGVIRIRKIRQHARCSDCARLSAMRAKAETQAQKDDLLQQLSDHRALVFRDRGADYRLNTVAEDGDLDLTSTQGAEPASAEIRCQAQVGVYPHRVHKLLDNYTHSIYTHPWYSSTRGECIHCACD
jgi:hypothetical protein